MLRNRTLISFALLGVTCLGGVVLLRTFSSIDTESALLPRARRLAKMDFKTADFSQPAIPQDILDKVAATSPTTSSVTVLGIPVHVIRVEPKSPSKTNVLLLHGQAFSSATWQDLGTIQTLGAMGHSVAAIDLPGFGKTPSKATVDKASFLEELMSELSFKPEDTVIVSPSMSGGFSLSLLNKHPNLLKGFVPVAPVGTDKLRNPSSKGCDEAPSKDSITHPVLQKHAPSVLPDLSCFVTPTLVVFGERDSSGFLQGCAIINSMPHAGAHMIPNARHPAYLDNPQLWHTLLYNFLAALQ